MRLMQPETRHCTAQRPEDFNTVVEFLAQRGAKLDVKNKRGQTPLAMTAGQQLAFEDSQAYKSTADLLRKLGAKE